MDFLGPMGGALAVAFGSGCAAGYGFAVKTIVVDLKKRVAALEEKVAAVIDARFKDLKELTGADDKKKP